jgi:two-component system phosphate regulon sensor histidine kinase PhoR
VAGAEAEAAGAPREGPRRPARGVSAWFLAVAGAVLAGLLAFGVAVAVPGPDRGAPLLVLAGVLPALAVLGLAAAADRQVLGPVRRLSRAAARLSAGVPDGAGAGADGAVAVEGGAAVSALAGAVNALAARLRAEAAALAAEHDRTAVVLSSMADGLIIVDRQLRVQRVNAAAARLLEVDAAAAAGESLTAVVRDHELAGLLHAAVAEQRSCTADVRVAPPRGVPPGDPREAPRFVRASGYPIPGGGAPADPAGLLMLQDVTGLRRSEAVRRDFVGNVSHELRTPLASLKALVETLEEGALEDPPAAREFLAQMHVEVDSLTQMVQELLDLSKIESGQATLRPEAVPAAGLAAEAESRLRMQAERAGVALFVDAPPDLPRVRADPARVGQVLINLLHNAIKFTPPGGEVVLRAAPGAGHVTFTVADTGAGIAPLDLPRIFERFYKADRSRASGGSGLGLAIAKHIVQAHGGRLWAESPGEGAGATFAFTLPVAAPDDDPTAGAPQDDPTAGTAALPGAALRR